MDGRVEHDAMIAVLDVNIIAGRKLAEALSERVDGVLRYAVRHYAQAHDERSGEMTLRLPPGWASKLAGLAMPLARRATTRDARARGGTIDTVLVTVPQYLPLARRMREHTDIVYYCSDDFPAYVGWDTARTLRDEGALCRLATLSIFVSEALRARAVADYGVDPGRTLVLPNASEARFAQPVAPPPEIAALPGPVFGVAGVFASRIDFGFLAACADHPGVGALALVGPVEAEVEGDPALARLRASDKVHFFGRQPHETMHAWMAAFDVALIPYAPTEFNRYCSPMRLYDHRAIGQPILATRHCDQINAHADVLKADRADLPAAIERALAAARAPRTPALESWSDRIDALQSAPNAQFLFRA